MMCNVIYTLNYSFGVCLQFQYLLTHVHTVQSCACIYNERVIIINWPRLASVTTMSRFHSSQMLMGPKLSIDYGQNCRTCVNACPCSTLAHSVPGLHPRFWIRGGRIGQFKNVEGGEASHQNYSSTNESARS